MADSPAENYFRARTAVVEHIERTGERAGAIVCPICTRQLHYSQAPNGHIHARCANPECVGWME